VFIKEGELIFKADIVSDTPSVIYLEGIWTAAKYRGEGYGLRCMSHLARNFLTRTKSICLLVNEQNTAAHNFYGRAGYKLRSTYDTIFLR
jgi:predicted GNAT family acetyltransferase